MDRRASRCDAARSVGGAVIGDRLFTGVGARSFRRAAAQVAAEDFVVGVEPRAAVERVVASVAVQGVGGEVSVQLVGALMSCEDIRAEAPVLDVLAAEATQAPARILRLAVPESDPRRPMSDYHYLIRGGIEGRERLRVLSRVMRPTTLPLLARAAVTAGLRCLDVGCGGGDVSFELASLVGPTGRVLGLDIDASKIDLARADAAQVAVDNVEFRVGDLTDGLGDEEYDVVYARFVLTHLSDPVAGVATMKRALRPGGRLVVEDIDFRGSFCEPESATFARYEDIYEESARASGGDPWIALRVPAMLVAAGLDRVQPTIVQPADLVGESKVMPALTLENIRGTALRHGVATAEEIDRLVDELYALARDETTFVANPRMVQVIGVKPP